MLKSVADFMNKLTEIQEKLPDQEFIDNYLHGIISRQTYSAYKNGTRTVASEFIDAVVVILPELHLLGQIAKDEIGREFIRKAESAKGKT